MANKLQTSNFKLQTSKKQQSVKNQTQNYFDLEERMAKFGEDVIKLCKQLPQNAITRPLISQIIRSATSIGANYSEANKASSKKDFCNKVRISKKEAQETKHWLRMLSTACPELSKELRILWKETHELTLILQTIVNKVTKTDSDNV